MATAAKSPAFSVLPHHCMEGGVLLFAIGESVLNESRMRSTTSIW